MDSMDNNNVSLQLIFGISLLCIQLVVLKRFLGAKKGTSPIYIVIITYLFVGIAGYFSYVFFPDVVYASTEINAFILRVTDDEAFFTLVYFFNAVNAIVFGAIIFSVSRIILPRPKNRRKKVYVKSSNPKFGKKINAEGRNKNAVDFNVVLLSCFLTNLLFVLGVGFNNILIAKSYLAVENQPLATISSLALYVTSALLGYALAESKEVYKKLIFLLLILINLLLVFSTASRRMAVVPILFTVGYSFSLNKNQKIGKLMIVVCAFLVLPLLSLPLSLRGQQSHGLIPYFQYLREMDPVDLFGVNGVFKNIIFSFPLTFKVTEYRNEFDITYFLTSISPMPGNGTNWYEINNNLRLNYFTPFNLLGEAYLYGDLIFYLLFSNIGLLTMLVSYTAENVSSTRKGKMFALILTALTMAFSIFSLQYNTRAALRYLYWAVIGSLIARK
jgi:hypothetical protein